MTTGGSGGLVATGDLAVATVAARSYFPFARVLARSFRRRHPEVPVFALVADRVDAGLDPAGEPFVPIELEAVGIPRLRRFRFQYTRREMAVALKPFLLGHLLDRGFRRVLFLDADLRVFDDLSPLFAALERSAILLTPHLLDPLSGATGAQRELAVLRAGVFNNGVVGVAERPEARRYLAWWQERLFCHCRLAPAEGLHHDQRWNDLAPAFFRELHVERDAGVNVGYWNLPERAVERRGGALTAAGRPLRCFHFSGFDALRPERLSRHLPESGGRATGAVAELCASYARELEAANWGGCQRAPYGFGCFDDGTPIPDLARAIYAALGDRAERFGDPFSTAGPESFAAWLATPGGGDAEGGAALSPLWVALLDRRPDVRAAFPDPGGRDRDAFLAWLRSSGAREHGLEGRFLPAAGPAPAA